MSDKPKTPALFTPLYEPAIIKYGLICAAVYGEVWRYCQMPQKMCVAAKETIAENLGLCLRTVVSCINQLCAGDEPYLKDLTPDVRNRPHAYVDTGQCRIDSELGMQEMHTSVQEMHTTEPETPPDGVQTVHTTMQEMHTGMQEIPGRYAGNAQEESIKRDLIETSQETGPPLERKTLTPEQVPKPDPELKTRWTDEILPDLRGQVDLVTYQEWFAPVQPLAVQDGALFLAVNEFYEIPWITRVHGAMIKRTCSSILGQPLDVQFIALPPPGGT